MGPSQKARPKRCSPQIRWLRFFLAYVLGDYPTLIPELGPLPKWNEWFVMGELGPHLSDEEIVQLIAEKCGEPTTE
jgi:hypothetical protein